MTLSPTQYFLRYAVPCAGALVQLQKLSIDDHATLEEAAHAGTDFSPEQLIHYFPAAYRRLVEVAGERNPWTTELIREYFQLRHNEYIDRRDGTYATQSDWFCEFCKVKELPVLEINKQQDKLFLKVEPKRWVYSPFFEPQVGDKVWVHHSYAVEPAK